MQKVILTREHWSMIYLDAAANYQTNCGCTTFLSGPVILLSSIRHDVINQHWHARRVFGRGREVTELVMLAVQHMKTVDERIERARLAAEVAEEEAKALMDLISEISI